MCMERHEVIVVGGGPVGMHALAILEKEGLDVILLEASSVLGGQLDSLYPAKTVDDVKGYEPMKGHELFLSLLAKIDKAHVRRNTKVTGIQKQEDETFLLATTQGEYQAKALFLATGLGFYQPRTMGLEGEQGTANIFYALSDPSILEGKKVVVLGGGDSALDWAKELCPIADVSLVHRRNEFRGDGHKIDGLPIKVYLSYIPAKLEKRGNICTGIHIESVVDHSDLLLACDAILVNFGLVPESLPLPYEKASSGFGYLSDEHSMVEPNVYVIGDLSYKEGKRKRMEPGFEEAERAIASYLVSR